jgi:hypothetical protein
MQAYFLYNHRIILPADLMGEFTKLLKLKNIIQNISLEKVSVGSAYFFKIRKRSPLLRKRKNTNLQLTLMSRVNKEYSNSSLHDQVKIWGIVANFIRRRYRMHVGVLPLQRLNKNMLEFVLINPNILLDFL